MFKDDYDIISATLQKNNIQEEDIITYVKNF
jgi:hypothetical protein